MSGFLGRDRSADAAVEGFDEFAEQVEKLLGLGIREGREEPVLRPLGRVGEAAEHGAARIAEHERLLPAIVGVLAAQDQPVDFELADHKPGRGAIEAHEARQADLVEAGPVREHPENAVLGRRHAQSPGLLAEYRERDLVRTPDHESGAAV